AATRASRHGHRLRRERHRHPHRRHRSPPSQARAMTFALIGSESLLGREIRDHAGTCSPALELRLIAALGEQPAKLTLVGDEPALVSGGGLEGEGGAGARAVSRAGPANPRRGALNPPPQPPGPAIIDLTGA